MIFFIAKTILNIYLILCNIIIIIFNSIQFNFLESNNNRLQFLELQLELIDDWRVRLLQLLHENYEDPLTSLMPCILNTLYYVATVLEEWGVTVVSILNIYFKKKLYMLHISDII